MGIVATSRILDKRYSIGDDRHEATQNPKAFYIKKTRTHVCDCLVQLFTLTALWAERYTDCIEPTLITYLLSVKNRTKNR